MLPTLLRGARTHNLKGIDLDLAPGEVVAITGVSGSGKSSLAMDTLYAEGQRRFVESFSPYARQFLERLERPPMESLDPVPAGIAVDRRAPIKSSRSTVATMADLEPYFAALFARESVPHCPEHGVAAVDLDAHGAAMRVLDLARGGRALLSYPYFLEDGRDTDEYLLVRDGLVRDGYRRVIVGNEAVDFDGTKPSTVLKGSQGILSVVVDRFSRAEADHARVAASLEQAWARGRGLAHVTVEGARHSIRSGPACPVCARPLERPFPGLFSYESPLGACPTCRGFGRTIGVDVDKVIPDPGKTIAGRAVRAWNGKTTSWERGQLMKLCTRNDVPTGVPWGTLTSAQKKVVLEGDGSWNKGKFPGVLGWFRWLEKKTYKMHVRVFLARYRSYDPCADCGGSRLNEVALRYRVADKNLPEWHALEVREAHPALDRLETARGQGDLARRELVSRLRYLDRVGLGYLTINRQARSLSGGEAQRVTLTAALGTSLENALFVLDEPTVGLHPTDVAPLGEMMRELAERGSTVLVVEHDASLIRAADRVVELGPGAGALGGRITADGAPIDVAQGSGATARALAPPGAPTRQPRKARGKLTIHGARANNLLDVTVEIPLGVLVAITGPSGSGKSTLAVDVLFPALSRALGDFDVDRPGAHDRIAGAKSVARVGLVDQSPLGRTSRGNAATYTKAWDTVRKLFAAVPAARAQKLEARHFSFNVDGGRCKACSGEGWETVEMQFLADVHLVCPSCKGKRFEPHVLAVHCRGITIADLLDETVDRALEIFHDNTPILRALGPLARLGLGYLRLGQPLSTLSGGEAQRLKLARALAEDQTGALLILDEPSAGLHADEVAKLLDALHVIVDAGATVVIVEHDLDVIRAADHVIDLGPDAGASGGRIVFTGTPDEVARSDTRTGRALSASPPPLTRRARAQAPRRRALSITRAREHNLADVSVDIPHGALTVVTGPSGSGKSTLAFDVVFAEGQRRFLETLTPYARQFLPTMPRANVDSVTGVPPSIALEQRTARAGSKSTVATVTEVAHYLRLAYAKLGIAHCPDHDEPSGAASVNELFSEAKALEGSWEVCAPVVRSRKGTYLDVFNAAARDGIEEAWCDGARVQTDDPPRLAKTREHTIDLVLAPIAKLDRVVFDRALRWGNGAVKLRTAGGAERLLSTRRACPTCGLAVPELDPRWFSFATAQGRCATCDGEGVVGARRTVCTSCGGSRLAPVPRAVRLQGERYHEISHRSVASTLDRVRSWRFLGDAKTIATPVVRELERRLAFLVDVGLDYLSLDRAAATLSGGEMQRLRLAAQLGAGLTGALYVLDEPTIGLHPKDTARLLENLRDLVRLGSTVLVVEHDADTIRYADYLIDLGPGGGSRGGRIVASGEPKLVLANADSPTARALAAPPDLRARREIPKAHPRLTLSGASEHNLRDASIEVPLGRFTVVAGVSGSGKSTLVRSVLLPAVMKKLRLATDPPGAHRELRGHEALHRAVSVDQSPIGRTPRSVPATFLGVFDDIRRLFAATPEARARGFAPARFSFNTPKGGRCTACDGQGAITHEMSFLPDVVTACAACAGMRFEPQTLGVTCLGLTIGETLKLTAEDAATVFANHPRIARALSTLTDLGAGYIQLGQGSPTLSGGEAQRLKLAAELTAGARHEPTLYVLDEPTTGLHLADVSKLVNVLGRLVERGDTLVVIEHHPVVIAGADWVIELGPGGGERGGRVIASGTPSAIAKKQTATGVVLTAQGLV